jgi:site-specific recombinase XerD
MARLEPVPFSPPDPPVLAPRSAPLALTTPWRVVVDAYLNATTDSPHTRRAYQRHLHAAFIWLGVATVAELHGAQLAAYRAHVVGGRLSPASQSQALAALRAFLHWSGTMGAHGLPGDVIRAALKTPGGSSRKPYQVLSEPEGAALLIATKTPRDLALLAVMLGAGLRAAEAVGLDIADVLADQEGGAALHVRQGKGRKDRIVPIQADVARAIRAYLASTGRHLGEDGPLFRAHDRAATKLPRGRLTTRAAGYVVERATKAAGVDAKKISPHSLRHTFAIRSLRRRHDVIAVQKLLGHASVATTQRYLDHLDLAELRQAVPELPHAQDTPGVG